MKDNGATFTLNEVVDAVHNFNGGVREESRVAGQLFLAATINTDKAWACPAARFRPPFTYAFVVAVIGKDRCHKDTVPKRRSIGLVAILLIATSKEQFEPLDAGPRVGLAD